MQPKYQATKNCDMIAMKDLISVTGYIRGACSPIGMKKLFPTFIHESCLETKQIYISGGRRGLQILVAPHDIILLTNAQVNNLI